MRLFLSIIAIIILTCTATPNAQSEPLVTISCEKPNGFNIAYGASFTERVGADQKKQPEPAPSLKGPTKDGYSGTPTFIIDSNEKKMTAVWAELPEDVELRKKAKELNIARMPPPPASEATIVWFSKDQISAIEVEPWSVTTYSFYPRFGTAFIGQQGMDLGLKNTRQLATFAHCEFSWTNPNDDPGKKRQ
jgi:hypothetical protein